MMSYEEYILFSLKSPSFDPQTDSCIFHLSEAKPKIDIESLPLLNLGIKHVPIPRDTTNEAVLDHFSEFQRKTLWKSYFKDNPNLEDPWFDLRWYVKKTNPVPFPNYFKRFPTVCKVSKIFDSTSDLVRDFIASSPRKKIPPDLKKIQDIKKNNPDFVFLQTDKNLGFASMHIRDYHKAVMTHLNSEDYELIHSDFNGDNFSLPFFQNLGEEAYFLALEIEHFIGKQATTFILQNKLYDLPNFHVLPKVHKKYPPIKTRPIVGAVNWITTPFSKVLDAKLQEFLKEVKAPSILKNTQELTDCLDKFQLPREQQVLIVSLDVTSLYTNINLELLSSILAKENLFLDKMFKFVTNNNYFLFNNQVYRQKQGLAMGTNAAVNLANFYLATLLDKVILQEKKVLFYKRFIDDLFLFWTGTIPELNAFKLEMDNLIPGIKFTMESSNQELPFLDLNIMLRSDNQIHYSVYQKPMHKFQYLTRKSCHPPHTTKGVVKGELQRYFRNSSHKSYFDHTRDLFYRRLLRRGYSEKYLIPIFNDFTWFKLLEKQSSTTQTDPKKPLALLFPYSVRPGLIEFYKKLRNILLLLEAALPEYKLILTHSKSQAIGEILCSSKISTEQSKFLLANI